MTPSLQTEKRQFLRVPLDASVRAEKVPQPSPNRIWNLLPEDLSESGLRLTSPELFPVESRLLINIDTEIPADTVRTVGIVVWVAQVPHQDHWSIGVAFSDVSDSERAQLRRIVADRQAIG